MLRFACTFHFGHIFAANHHSCDVSPLDILFLDLMFFFCLFSVTAADASHFFCLLQTSRCCCCRQHQGHHFMCSEEVLPGKTADWMFTALNEKALMKWILYMLYSITERDRNVTSSLQKRRKTKVNQNKDIRQQQILRYITKSKKWGLCVCFKGCVSGF